MYRFEQVTRLTTPAVLAAVAAAHPGRPFIIAEDGDLTYAMMARSAARLARQFRALGLRTGDRVGILLPNGSRWCATLLGAHTAGLVVVPLNTWYRGNELLSVARRAGLRTIITQEEIFGFESGRQAAAIGEALAEEASGGEHYLGSFLWPRDASGPEGLPAALSPSEHADSDEIITPNGPAGSPGITDELGVLLSSPAAEADDALLLFTSGSSAQPKAVRLTQGGLVATAHAIGERQGIREGDRFWFASPLFFVFGCSNALPNALTHAATLCLQERFEAARALEYIERHRCTVYYAVAPFTRALAATPGLASRDISSLRTGTANATAEDLRLAIEVLGVTEVCNAYGMTEGHGHTTITSCTDPASARIGSQGRVLPTQELRIVADGAVVGAEEPGEIQIRGLISPGYLDSPGGGPPAGTGASSGFGDDGWFRTGDIGWLDADGNLHYVGRSHEMMKVKGINIAPAEVETLLVQHERVDEAFVFGLATPDGDQSVGCVLVSTVSPDAREELIADVAEWMRGHAAAYKVPTTIRVITAAELPMTGTGKVSKRLLQEDAQARMATTATIGADS
ncbi:MAG TPA: class I adenylate-forming enzyme family protein [Trebonia sp.]|jgi:fatty-acyl-CoA synthase|nr:class I adenylate-forming enzyme family protein [Trebonia sp.]